MADSGVRVLAVVGRNPAPLAQLAWALASGRGVKVREVRCVVLGPRAAHHLHDELLAHGAAWEQLRQVVGDLLPRDVEFEVVDGDAGVACWRQSQALTAGREPVCFAAFPGRHRRPALQLATCFNFLGRQRDEFLDVELSVRGTDGMTGFYFPGQLARSVRTPEGVVLAAAEVEVLCESVPLPRLRRLLPTLAESAWETVAVLGQRGLNGMGPPELVVDLESGTARVGGVPLQLAPLPLAWLATLARARRDGTEGGWVYSDSTAELAQVLARCAHQPWVACNSSKVLKRLLSKAPGAVTDGKSHAYLSRVRHLCKQKLQRLARKHFPVYESHLVPEVGQSHSSGGPDHRQRLPLSPECIHLHGL